MNSCSPLTQFKATTLISISTIQSSALKQKKLRDEIAQQFPVLVSRLVNWPVGPHVKPMFQVNFPPAEFGSLVPLRIVKRRGLSVLIHPNSGRPRR